MNRFLEILDPFLLTDRPTGIKIDLMKKVFCKGGGKGGKKGGSSSKAYDEELQRQQQERQKQESEAAAEKQRQELNAAERKKRSQASYLTSGGAQGESVNEEEQVRKSYLGAGN